MVIERAFGRLKGRWQSLLHALPVADLQGQIAYIEAACLMHNFVEQNNDKCLKKWSEDPEVSKLISSLKVDQPEHSFHEVDGSAARDAVMAHVNTLVDAGALPKATARGEK